MLTIKVGGQEMYDENLNQFFNLDEIEYSFEHSLKAIAEWESEYKLPFPIYNGENFADEEQMLFYFQCMSLSTTPLNFTLFEVDDFEKILKYMSTDQTATTIHSRDSGGGSVNRITTAEVIYANMFNGQVPLECENWNITRLMKTLNVIGESNKPKEKMSRADIIRQQKAQNARLRQKFNSKG